MMRFNGLRIWLTNCKIIWIRTACKNTHWNRLNILRNELNCKKMNSFAQKKKILIKDKVKEALFKVAYNVTDNNSSRAILRHDNIFNRYLPALLYLPSTTPFMQASARELLVPFFTHLVWCGRGIRTHDLPLRKADALLTQLSRLFWAQFLLITDFWA